MSYYFAKVIEAPFSEAVARTKAALSARGFGVLSEIDVSATLPTFPRQVRPQRNKGRWREDEHKA